MARLLKIMALLVPLIALLAVAGFQPVGAGGLIPQELLVFGQSDWLSDSAASLRIVFQNHNTEEAIQGASVRVSLSNEEGLFKLLASGKTDRSGVFQGAFHVPDLEPGDYHLMVRALGSGATATVKRDVRLVRQAQVYLVTDKPLYQPGQLIHLRAVALKSGLNKALAGEDCLFTVEDPKGNRVFKQTFKSNEYGVAAADFQLADEVNLGEYRVKASFDAGETEKVVTVKRYVLPKYKINLSTDRDWYLPGQQMKVDAQVDYFFGKPVAGGTIKLDFSTFDVGRDVFHTEQGKTDEKGHFSATLTLPATFVGQPFLQGQGSVELEATVVDLAQHEEKASQSRAVVPSPLDVQIIPEAGAPVAGIVNRFFLVTTYPDGSPARCTVNVKGDFGKAEVKTDETGYGEYEAMVKAGEVTHSASARDSQGQEATEEFSWGAEATETPLLLRVSKSIARVGDSLTLTALTPLKGRYLYFDAVKDGQTVLTEAMRTEGGQAQVELPLTADLVGSVTLHAYVIQPDMNIVSATKLVVVMPAEDLKIEVRADRDEYKPAEQAVLRFAVEQASGLPTPACLGVAIVDESVFALAEAQSGLAKIYFLLEKELMEPKFEIHGMELPDLLEKPVPVLEQPGTQHLAEALMAAASPTAPEFSLTASSYLDDYAQQVPELLKQLTAQLEEVLPVVEAGWGDNDQDATKVVDRLLKAGKLKEAQLLDPWGKRYQVTGSSSWDLAFTSAGPDGRLETSDDLGPVPAWVMRWGELEGEMDVQRIAGDLAAGRAFGLDEFGGGFGGGRGGGMLAEGVMFKAGVMEDRAMMPMAAASGMANGMGAGPGAPAGKPVHVREYFPETMYWNPALVTDANGKAEVNLEMADSITSWRLTALANSANGLFGSLTTPIKVFQDFFVDLDLPVALTQGDEVSVPVAVYNYLKTSQSVKLQLEAADWYELLDNSTKTLQIGPDDIQVVYFRLKAKQLGNQKLTVFAYGTKLSDAIRRSIEIVPDGTQIESVANGRLSADTQVAVNVPTAAIDGASQVLVRLYPGMLSQAVEGLEKLLQMPYGCFEQTTSVTYPNALVLQYLESSGKVNPELAMQAEQYLNVGYQRMISYEVDGGGFEWFGNPPANKLLTAWGVQAFTDMAKVFPVDERIIERTQNWLISQQKPDGSFDPEQEYYHAEHWASLQNGNLLPTAYIAWALASTGVDRPEVGKAVDYVVEHLDQAKTNYELTLCANAIIWARPESAEAKRAATMLAERRKDEGQLTHWEAGMATASYSSGNGADVEATSLAAMALLKERQPARFGTASDELAAGEEGSRRRLV